MRDGGDHWWIEPTLEYGSAVAGEARLKMALDVIEAETFDDFPASPSLDDLLRLEEAVARRLGWKDLLIAAGMVSGDPPLSRIVRDPDLLPDGTVRVPWFARTWDGAHEALRGLVAMVELSDVALHWECEDGNGGQSRWSADLFVLGESSGPQKHPSLPVAVCLAILRVPEKV